MAIRASGLKINDKELKKFADRVTEKYVKRYISAGNKAQKEIREKYTIDWFLNKSTTMVNTLDYTHKLVQKDGKAYLYFASYVNMGKFEMANIFNRASIYDWANRYNAGINPSQYLLDLQWNQGIHGLPREWTRPNYRFGQSWNDGVSHWYNPYYNQGMPMSSYVKLGFQKEWETTVKKYLKR